MMWVTHVFVSVICLHDFGETKKIWNRINISELVGSLLCAQGISWRFIAWVSKKKLFRRKVFILGRSETIFERGLWSYFSLLQIIVVSIANIIWLLFRCIEMLFVSYFACLTEMSIKPWELFKIIGDSYLISWNNTWFLKSLFGLQWKYVRLFFLMRNFTNWNKPK